MLKENKFISLKEVQPFIVECYAHRKLEEPKESVIEHTELCQKYFTQIVNKKQLAPIFTEFRQLYFGKMSEAGKELFEVMLANVISFHDIGKMNPLFQERKMEHPWKKEMKPNENIGSEHSIISAVVYLDYFFDRVKQIEEKTEREALKDLAYIHSFIIARHHSSLNEFLKYLEGFSEESDNARGWYAKEWLKCWEWNVNKKESELKVLKRNTWIKARIDAKEEADKRFLYTYVRLLYSLLVAADYYATSEYMSGTEITDFGEIADSDKIYEEYQKTDVLKSIRKYEAELYPMDKAEIDQQKDINILRTEIFLETERVLESAEDHFLYYLEAPTGSGKSNTAMNLSFKLLQKDPQLKKIFYIYPFNTLVEQNMESLAAVFGNNPAIMSQIAIVNSLVPLKENEEYEGLDKLQKYQKILLDRQFLNYPIILSTHASLFHTMFGDGREAVFGFHQLCNSVIILDEIQSYRNEIWSEIIHFFKTYAKLLNIKVIIMSATLPNLEVLTNSSSGTMALIQNRDRYFKHPLFCDRVIADYSLLESQMTLEALLAHIIQTRESDKKVLIEFIKKESAYEFYELISAEFPDMVLLMTGDSSILERKKIIRTVKEQQGIILVATQVIEAGVDIDMDIGYKDISKLDSEEQFMGRINRSCKKKGIVYFFDMDSVSGIYKKDFRSAAEFTLREKSMREILSGKNYDLYYREILDCLKRLGTEWNDNNIEHFFKEAVGYLNFPKVEKRMRLIENRQMVSIYLARRLETDSGEVLDGKEIWEEYVMLLQENEMEYAEKAVKLFRVRSLMNGFLYQINQGRQFTYTEQVGDIFYIENGEDYFEDGILNRKKLGEQEDLFI